MDAKLFVEFKEYFGDIQDFENDTFLRSFEKNGFIFIEDRTSPITFRYRRETEEGATVFKDRRDSHYFRLPEGVCNNCPEHRTCRVSCSDVLTESQEQYVCCTCGGRFSGPEEKISKEWHCKKCGLWQCEYCSEFSGFECCDLPIHN